MNEIHILDIKSSTGGWRDADKKSDLKKNQLLLYKQFFSDIFNFPKDKIKVKFLILRRKLWEESPYPMSRFQEFEPPAGTFKLKECISTFNEFIKTCYSDTGTHNEVEYPANPSTTNCRFCPYAGNECKNNL